MADEPKRRSGSFSSQVTADVSSESAKKLSLSEGSIVDKETSPQSNVSLESQESSPAGTLKKPRKFKPRKYIAKKLKLRKSDDPNTEPNTAESQSEQESIRSSSSKLSDKLSSPKLQRFNLIKRFSSGKKSYRVSPLSDDGDDSKEKLRSLSVSESSVHENEPKNFVSEVQIPLIPTQAEPVTLESKKVELKITMAKYEKRATSPSALERTPVDKASSEASRDIELPRASRDQFYAKPPYVEQREKPINEEESFAVVVRDGIVKTKAAENPSEVEKYSILTSSLQTILSTAKDLEEFGARGGVDEKELKFPELPDLKILEEGDKEAEQRTVQREVAATSKAKDTKEAPTIVKQISKEASTPGKEISEKASTSVKEISKKASTSVKEISKEALTSVNETPKEVAEEKSPFGDIFQKISKPTNFDTSTPIRPEELEDTDDSEMRKQKKSKIPVDQKRLSASFDASTAKTTVHTQEAKNPYHVNLSASSSSESSRAPSETNLSTGEIKFELGTPVKNFPSPTGSTSVLAPMAISEASMPHDSSEEVFHSPISEKSLQPESITRRKIEFVPQLTIYTQEEQELLKSNFAANADSFDLSSAQADSSVFPVFDDSVGSTMSNSPDKREHLYKILVIGELGTGKTSFIKRYVHQFFSQNYRATIGVDFALKVLNWDQSTIIRLQLWDIAGQERFGNMTRVYYKEAVGAFIVFDVTRSATFDAVIKWKQDLDTKVQLPDGSPIPTILLANKCDQQKQGLCTMPAKMDEYCKTNGFAGWFEVSAKDNVNIEESAKALVSKILVNDKLINNDILDGDRIVLDPEENSEKKKFCSC